MKTENIIALAAGGLLGYFVFKQKEAGVGAVNTDGNGFNSISIKMPGMRSAQDWTLYPYKGGDTLILQSSTRIMEVNLRTGKTVLSKSRSNGSYFHDLLSIRGASIVDMPENYLIEIQKYLWDNEGQSGGSNVISWENKELFSE